MLITIIIIIINSIIVTCVIIIALFFTELIDFCDGEVNFRLTGIGKVLSPFCHYDARLRTTLITPFLRVTSEWHRGEIF